MDKEDVAYTWNGILFSHKQEWNLAIFDNLLMDLEGFMLNEVGQTEKDKYHMISLIWNLNKQAKNANLYLENILVITRSERWKLDKMVWGGQKVQTSSYKINKFFGI